MCRRVIAVILSSMASLLTAAISQATVGQDFFVTPEPVDFFAVLFLFSLFGGIGRLLFLWELNVPWQRQIGSLILSVFGSWTIGLYFWETLHPTVLMASAGALSALGGEVVEQVAKRMTSSTILKP